MNENEDLSAETAGEQESSGVLANCRRLKNGELPAPYRKLKEGLDREKIQDVTDYILPDELESRLMNYHDDVLLTKHVKRAHKYYSTIQECRDKNPWKVEVKGHDELTDTFPKLYFCKKESIPTPDEIRDYGVSGKFCFVLTYYDPLKGNRRNVKEPQQGGYVSIVTTAYDIPARRCISCQHRRADMLRRDLYPCRTPPTLPPFKRSLIVSTP